METETRLIDLRHMTAQQLATFGVSKVAYVKVVMLNGAPAYAIHGADGTPMAVAGDRDVAIQAIVEHEMVPALVH